MKNTKISKSGEIGEDIAVRFLISTGYTIIDRNCSYKFGEVDIIAKKGGIISFFEVKSQVIRGEEGISREPSHEPEELVNAKKIRKIEQVASMFINRDKDSLDYEIKVIAVFLDMRRKIGRVRVTPI